MARLTAWVGRHRMLPAAVTVLTVLAVLAGVLVAVLSRGPGSDLAGPGKPGPGATAAASSPSPAATSAANAPVIGKVPLTLGRSSHLLPDSPVPAVSAAATTRVAVAPLRRTVQADLIAVAPFSLPGSLLTAVDKLPGVVAAEPIEAFQLKVANAQTAVLGVDPSSFRSFAARPTGAATALWQGVADGGIALSYSMGQLDKIPLGSTVPVAGETTRRLPVVAFGTLGIGAVNAVVSDATARALGAPAGNAIVVSVRTADFTADAAAFKRLMPKGASAEPLITLSASGTAVSGAAGSGSASGTGVAATATDAMLRAALSRLGMPYVWGAAGPTSFDCSGLVQWSFAQAGIVMPRVAADQALSGPAVPVSQLEPGDLLFYHTDPTAPDYISHVAIYLGQGRMIQAPEPGEDVEIVPADFGSEFAGAVRVNPAQAAAVAGQPA